MNAIMMRKLNNDGLCFNLLNFPETQLSDPMAAVKYLGAREHFFTFYGVAG